MFWWVRWRFQGCRHETAEKLGKEVVRDRVSSERAGWDRAGGQLAGELCPSIARGRGAHYRAAVE